MDFSFVKLSAELSDPLWFKKNLPLSYSKVSQS